MEQDIHKVIGKPLVDKEQPAPVEKKPEPAKSQTEVKKPVEVKSSEVSKA